VRPSAVTRTQRADGLRIGRAAAERDVEPVAVVAAVVAVEAPRTLVVVNEDVDIAIAIVVEGDDAAALEGVRHTQFGTALDERAIAVADEEDRADR
jgi:hypothetical protein